MLHNLDSEKFPRKNFGQNTPSNMTNDLTPLTYDMLDKIYTGVIATPVHTPLPTRKALPGAKRKPSLADPCYVVAGNYNEFKSWMIQKDHHSLHYTYVSSIDTIRGLSDIHGLFIGTWRERKDIEEIKLYIDIIKNRKKVDTEVINAAGTAMARDIDAEILAKAVKQINGGPKSQYTATQINDVEQARRLLERSIADDIAKKWVDPESFDLDYKNSQFWTDPYK